MTRYRGRRIGRKPAAWLLLSSPPHTPHMLHRQRSPTHTPHMLHRQRLRPRTELSSHVEIEIVLGWIQRPSGWILDIHLCVHDDVFWNPAYCTVLYCNTTQSIDRYVSAQAIS